LKKSGNDCRMLLFGLLLVFNTNLYASLQVDISSDVISVDESVMIQVEAKGARSAVPISLPPLDGGEISFSGTMISSQSINGRSSHSIVLQFTVTALREGSLVIPPLRISVDGKEESTPSITIKVEKRAQTARRRSSGARSLIDEMFFEDQEPEAFFLSEKSVSATDVYVGEPVVTRYYLLCDKPIAINQGDKATQNIEQRTDFIVQPTSETIPQFTVRREERDFNRAHIGTWVLLPLRPGTYLIKNEIFDFIYRDRSSFIPDYTRKSIYFEDRPLRVHPLPAGAPLGFSGSVGSYTVSISPSAVSTAVETPVVVEVTVGGSGNFYGLTSPQFAPNADVQFLPLERKESFRVSGNSLSGSVTYRWQIVPLKEGDISIEGVTLAFFDPSKKIYRVERSPRLNLSVKSAAALDDVPADAPVSRYPVRPLIFVGIVFFIICAAAGFAFWYLVRRDRQRLENPDELQSEKKRNNELKLKGTAEASAESEHAFLARMYIRTIFTAFAEGEAKKKFASLEKALCYLRKEHTFKKEIVQKLDSIQEYLNKARYGGASCSDELIDNMKSYIIAALKSVK